LNKLEDTIITNGFVKVSRAAPLLMPFFLRGAAMSASNLGHRKMIEEYGRQLADKGIDPFDLPGKKQDGWIDPTMLYGMGLGLAAHGANYAGLFGDTFMERPDKKEETLVHTNTPLYLGTALGGAIGAYKTYLDQRNLAKDFLADKKTEDTDYVKTRDYIKDTLDAQKKK